MSSDFYYILIFCFISFLIGYFVPVIFHKVDVKTPTDVKKESKKQSIQSNHKPIIHNKILTKNNLNSEEKTIDVDDIVPGQVRVKKTYDENICD